MSNHEGDDETRERLRLSSGRYLPDSCRPEYRAWNHVIQRCADRVDRFATNTCLEGRNRLVEVVRSPSVKMRKADGFSRADRWSG